MRVVVAPDKFAGSLSARTAAEAIATGWLRADPAASITRLPMSDGGPGFLDVMHAALGGRRVACSVTGPLGEPTPAEFLLVASADGPVAYVESAQACGLDLVSPSPATALEAETRGVGQLIVAALTERPAQIVVGVGGTASSDGGSGALAELGQTDLEGVDLVVATDVRAPLLGPTGAARAFAGQKGADPETIELLESTLTAWAGRTGGDPWVPGAGAGGGLGFGLLALGGSVVSGVELVMGATKLAAAVNDADLVITGEGRFDSGSLLGKVPSGVARLARDHRRPCFVLAGDCAPEGLGGGDLASSGITAVRAVAEVFGRRASLADPAARLEDLAALVAEEFLGLGPA